MAIDYTTLGTFGDLASNGVTVAADRITFEDSPRGPSYGLSRDDGAGAIGDFEARCDVLVTSEHGSDRGNVAVLIASNTVNDGYTLWSGGAQAVIVEVYQYLNLRFGLRQPETGVQSFISVGAGQYDNLLRVVLSRAGDTVTLSIYSDATETTLLGSTSVSVDAGRTYRYWLPFTSWATGSGDISGYVEGHDFGDSPAFNASWAANSNLVIA